VRDILALLVSMEPTTYIVQSMGRKSVCSSKKGIKVMCPEIIADETEYSNPKIGFHPIFLIPDLFGICFAFQNWGQENARQCSDQANHEITPFLQFLIKLERNEDAETPCDPDQTVKEEKTLCPPF
jgi:hypothetical protein